MNWLDIIGIGIDAAQYHQLSKLRGDVRAGEEGRVAEILRKETLDALRHVVFMSRKSAEALAEHVTKSPQAVYVATRLLEWRFTELGISPKVFSEHEDKDYAFEAQAAITKTLSDVRNKLSPEQVSQADACFKAIIEMPLLEHALEAQLLEEQLREKQIELESTDEEWGPLSRQKSKSTSFGLGVAFIVPASLCVGAILCNSIFTRNNGFGVTPSAAMSNLATAALCLVALCAVGAGLFLMLRMPSSKYAELRKQRSQVNQAKAELEKRLPGREMKDTLLSTFGAHTSKEFRDIKASRESLIRQVMGQMEDYDRFLLSAD